MNSARATDWSSAPAYVWDGTAARSIDAIIAPPLELLSGIDAQKERVLANVSRHAQGIAAHDILLWGSRGMGKSALIRSAVAHLGAGKLALVQLSADRLESLPALFVELRDIDRRFWLFVDDLGFAPGDLAGPRRLRSLLEGGVEARPENIRLGVTTNHRSILPRELDSGHSPRHERDAADDELALADRFGLVLGFHACDQDTYLGIVAGYAQYFGLDITPEGALLWAKQRGARSGRVAWQFIVESAGREGMRLPG
ncbi:ATP-binding protein [Parerythrobacter lacustris]|uniref:ATP-binding protein n=1 Tax=Parerythrobacter lacustris TaxID=2969984 RepID=A0ABT1XVK9_9SPHN|nr:ATP-binding protein [Parerythrobacter lacustris]MCR2834452.1 ATP-binding protein [Parerythrobacter lacustris]